MNDGARRRRGWRHAALALVPIACTGGGETGGSNGSAQTAARSTAVANLPQAPDFAIEVYQNAGPLGGEVTSLATILDQGKPVFLNFWAGLCPPCRAEMPELQAVYDAHDEEIVLVGIDLGPFTGLGTTAQGRDLLQDLGVRFPAGTTNDSSVVTDFQILGMPSTFFITASGGVARKWTGPLNEEKLTEFVQELLGLEDA